MYPSAPKNRALNCPTGCVDEAGECIPSNKRKTCTSFSCPPKHGHIANIGGECACGTGHAKSYNTLQECCDDVNVKRPFDQFDVHGFGLFNLNIRRH